MIFRMVWQGAEGATTPAALSIALAALTAWDEYLLASRPFPSLYRAGVRYMPEDYDGPNPEDWLDALEVLKRGGGDCEDLAAWRVAELRRAGELGARTVFVEFPDARGRLFHVLVERAGGSLEDPSRILGMR